VLERRQGKRTHAWQRQARHEQVNPVIRYGKSYIKGTRTKVSLVLDNLAADLTSEGVTHSYPALSDESVRAAIAYAADLACERVIALPAQRGPMRFKEDENLSAQLRQRIYCVQRAMIRRRCKHAHDVLGLCHAR
jgi:uncharacterized protein (DUF433 family)